MIKANWTRNDLRYLRTAIAVAAESREHGNHPFGAILVDESGEILGRAENTVITGRDSTGHAELNLVRLASTKFEAGKLAHTTLYTSTEPCPMCAGAIYWSGIKRVVYASSARRLYEITGDRSGMKLPASRAVLAVGNIEVLGPLNEEEAAKVHEGFWT